MDTIVILVGATLCTLISCGAAFISVFYSRKTASVELQSNVDELLAMIQKMQKEQRKEKMSRVRQGNQGVDNGSETLPVFGGAKEVGFSGGTMDGYSPRDRKALLRQKLNRGS